MIALSLSRELRGALFGFGFLLPVAIAILLRLALLGPSRAPIPEAAEELCDARRFDATCPQGQRCAAGLCLPAQVAHAAQAGERCEDERGCELGLECHRGRCAAVAELAKIVAPPTCRDPEVERVLGDLSVRCSKALGRDNAALGDCNAEMWRRISGERDFDRFMRELPGGISVFFPNAMPDKTGSWPQPPLRIFLRDRLAEHIAPLRAAKLHFVVARASTSGDRIANQELAQRRLGLVEALVQEASKSELTSRAWVLAASAEDSLEARRTKIAEGVVVASTEEEIQMLRGLPKLSDSELAQRETEYREMVNRVVDVVPLPCDKSEFFPRPALYERDEVQR